MNFAASICTACNRNGTVLNVANLDSLVPPATCFRGVRQGVYGFGAELYDMITLAGPQAAPNSTSTNAREVSHENKLANTALLVVLLGASCVVLFYGQGA